ncbi:MAG: hypothetical protein QXH20_04125 [Candidatus Bathyarchaeia archaeon]
MKTAGKVILAITAMFALFLVIARSANAMTGPNINLPPGQVTAMVDYPSDKCYYYVQVSNVPDGYHISNGRFLGWCVDEDHYIYNRKTYSARLYSSYDSNNPHPDPDWPKVNYILNNKQGSWEDVQAAIWYFVNGGRWPSDPDAQAMINAAKENGENFVPTPGQILAVIVWINENTQIPIIEVVVPLQNAVPEYPLGPIFGVASFFAALGVYKRKLRRIDLF